MIAFHHVKKSPLIIEIVDRIKINSEQLRYFHSASQSCPILSANCRCNLRLFRLFRSHSKGVDKSSSSKCLLYSDVVKGKRSPTGRGRRNRNEKDNQGVGDIRFTNILYLFSIYFFFSVTLRYHFFSILFLPTTFTHTHTHDPRPTTHDPRPTTFSYTQLQLIHFNGGTYWCWYLQH